MSFKNFTNTKAENDKKEIKKELGLTYNDILGKPLIFDFGQSVYKITYVSDTIHTY